MKKVTLVMMALALSAGLTACGGSKTETATTAAATEGTTAAAATTEAATTAAAEAAATVAAAEGADAEELVYTLNYDDIASWVDAGFIGIDESGGPVVMAIDAANENAIIIFGDNSDMTAVSFVGEITYEGDLATITDVANEMSLTFGVKELSEDTLELDMGEDIGKATIQAGPKEDVLETIKTAIENYDHIA